MGILSMNYRERKRKSILEWLKFDCCTLKEAARRMKVSYQQAKRI